MRKDNVYYHILRYVIDLLKDREHLAYDNKLDCYQKYYDTHDDVFKRLSEVHELYRNDYELLLEIIHRCMKEVK